MEVFGLRSQSLRYKMDGFGSVQMYLTPHDYTGYDPSAPHQQLMEAAAAAAAMTSTSSPEPRTTLVIGASRGIGMELVQQLSQQQPNAKVIASVHSAVDFGDHLNIQSIIVDQSSVKSINEAASRIVAGDI
ncbi:hypothetical protein NQ176_g7675 [Zarea fungicola]|uniref:Uncharacterized protein n=1 Tax=Zarea fungicola TaxID=93591 RepID=A0ACC1MYX2_9HYPO|nr:hypothetical protein NQ176_g7675 [Lecanicillium fungicola]